MLPVLVPSTACVRPPAVLHTQFSEIGNKGLMFLSKITNMDTDDKLRDFSKKFNARSLVLDNGVFVPLDTGFVSVSGWESTQGLYYDKDQNTYTPVISNKDGSNIVSEANFKIHQFSFHTPIVNMKKTIIDNLLKNLNVPDVFGDVSIGEIYYDNMPWLNYLNKVVVLVDGSWYLIKNDEVVFLTDNIYTLKGNKIHKTEPVHLVEPNEWKTGEEVNPKNLTTDSKTLINAASILIGTTSYQYDKNLGTLANSTETGPSVLHVKIRSPYKIDDPKYGKHLFDLLDVEYDTVDKLAFNNNVVDTSCLKGTKDFALVNTPAIVFDQEAISKFLPDALISNVVIKLSDEKKLSRHHCELLVSSSHNFYSNLHYELGMMFSAWKKFHSKNTEEETENKIANKFIRSSRSRNLAVDDEFISFIHTITKHVSLKLPVCTPRIGEEYNNLLSAVQREGYSISIGHGLLIQNNKLIESALHGYGIILNESKHIIPF